MIFFTSDIHGGENMTGLMEYLACAGEDDLLIILGDLMLQFQDTEENRRFTELFRSADKPIAFLDGNHENYAYLQSFPEETWCGGRVHRISDKVVYLRRGNIYDICGKSFFVMGGCKSSAKWKAQGLWYPGEEPSAEELALAYENLAKRGNQVDYVLTHRYENDPARGVEEFEALSLMGLLKYIDDNVRFTHWYSGHWHEAGTPDARHTVVFDQLVKLEQ